MKKKDKEKKKKDMPEFEFKQFTPEEDRIYVEAVNKFREAIAAGKPLKQVYDSYPFTDREFGALVQADFLKILIAEDHFAKGQTLDAMAGRLAVSRELLQDTKNRMLQEAGVASANQFAQEFGSLNPGTAKTND